MNKFDFDTWLLKIVEDISIDPNTLTNMILNKSMIKSGYNWVEQVKNNVDQEDIYKMAPVLANSMGDFIRETLQEAEKDKKDKDKEDKGSKDKKEQKPQQPVESNQRDPNMISSDPEFNPCPTYLFGICRIDGRPCPFSILDYKDCGKYFLAGSSDPDLMEIPVGREQDPSYAQGRKA
jgi:hypothetical protein